VRSFVVEVSVFMHVRPLCLSFVISVRRSLLISLVCSVVRYLVRCSLVPQVLIDAVPCLSFVVYLVSSFRSFALVMSVWFI